LSHGTCGGADKLWHPANSKEFKLGHRSSKWHNAHAVTCARTQAVELKEGRQEGSKEAKKGGRKERMKERMTEERKKR
jgi:hypothetical protein